MDRAVESSSTVTDTYLSLLLSGCVKNKKLDIRYTTNEGAIFQPLLHKDESLLYTKKSQTMIDNVACQLELITHVTFLEDTASHPIIF